MPLQMRSNNQVQKSPQTLNFDLRYPWCGAARRSDRVPPPCRGGPGTSCRRGLKGVPRSRTAAEQGKGTPRAGGAEPGRSAAGAPPGGGSAAVRRQHGGRAQGVKVPGCSAGRPIGPHWLCSK